MLSPCKTIFYWNYFPSNHSCSSNIIQQQNDMFHSQIKSLLKLFSKKAFLQLKCKTSKEWHVKHEINTFIDKSRKPHETWTRNYIRVSWHVIRNVSLIACYFYFEAYYCRYLLVIWTIRTWIEQYHYLQLV